jgi:hypothetical protein
MTVCMICGDTFTEATMGGPAEPCDCGHRISREDWQEMEPARFARLQDAWKLRRDKRDRRDAAEAQR